MVRGSRIKAGAYIAALHSASSFSSRDALHFAHARPVGDERALRRWRQSRNGSLRAFPSYVTESLGLSTCHVVLDRPDPRLVRFPYAVERAWVTPDFVQRQLYLLCFVPTRHLPAVRSLLSSLRDASWCASFEIIASHNGWQHVRECGHQHTLEPGYIPDGQSLLRATPLVVPLVMESWNRDARLTDLWDRIQQRLGASVRSYLSERRPQVVNGKTHVRAACRALAKADLFRQVIIRRDGTPAETCDAVVVGDHRDDRLIELIAELARGADSVDTFMAETGKIVIRASGSTGIVQTLLGANPREEHAPRVLLVDRERTERAEQARFAYEFLFNPKIGEWEYPREQIMEHLSR